MTTLKIIASITIILGSLAAGTLIVGKQSLQKAGSPEKPGKQNLSFKQAQNPPPVYTPQSPEQDTRTALALQGSAEPIDTEPIVRAEPVADDGNETRRFAELIAKQIANQDLSGPAGDKINLNDIDTEAVAESLVAGFAETDYEKFLTPVPADEIRTLTAKDALSYRAYFSSLEGIVKRNASGTSFDPDALSPDELALMESALAKIFKEALTLAVPAPLKELHRKQVELIGAQKNIFSALKELNEDPVRAFAAYRALPLVSREMAVVRAEFAGFLKRENISL